MFANRSRSHGYRLPVVELGDLEGRLRSARLRVTQPRLAVLAVLERARSEEAHLTVAEVVDRTREILGRLSPQTVYDCLEAMAQAGIVRRVELPGSPARYETEVADHHHLVCDRCGTVRNVARSATGTPALPPADAHGFQVLGAEVCFRGLCPSCARR